MRALRISSRITAYLASPFVKAREWSGWEPRHGRQSRKGSGRALREATEIQLR